MLHPMEGDRDIIMLSVRKRYASILRWITESAISTGVSLRQSACFALRADERIATHNFREDVDPRVLAVPFLDLHLEVFPALA